MDRISMWTPAVATIDDVCAALERAATKHRTVNIVHRLAELRATVCPRCELSLFCLRGTCEGVWCQTCLSYHVPSLKLNVDCDLFPVDWYMRDAYVSRTNTVRCPSCKEGEPPARRVVGAQLWPDHRHVDALEVSYMRKGSK